MYAIADISHDDGDVFFVKNFILNGRFVTMTNPLILKINENTKVPYAEEYHGKLSYRKSMIRIAEAHGIPRWVNRRFKDSEAKITLKKPSLLKRVFRMS